MTLRILPLACAAALAAAPALHAQPGEPVVPPGKTAAKAGTYSLDQTHSTLVFRLSHLGFSRYTASFDVIDGKLAFDPTNPAAIAVTATIDPRSLRLPAPPAGFKETLLGPNWLDAAKYPQISFRSTKVEPTGANAARVTGDLTLHGVTKPVTLEATFNGGYPPNSFDPGGRIGFSAHGVIKRSEFGVRTGLPAPGTNLGVGDQIDVAIETEWSREAPAAK